MQVGDHNNHCHSLISLERTLTTKCWEYQNAAWHLKVKSVNTKLAWGNFNQYDVVDKYLLFRQNLPHECLTNTIGMDMDNGEVVGRPLRTYTMSKLFLYDILMVINTKEYGF